MPRISRLLTLFEYGYLKSCTSQVASYDIVQDMNIEVFFDFLDQKIRFSLSIEQHFDEKNRRKKNQNPIINPKLSQDSKNHTLKNVR